METMSIRDYCDETGLRIDDIIDKVHVDKSTYVAWIKNVRTPSLVHTIILFLISDGHIGVFDLLSEKDQYTLEGFIDNIPEERLNQMVVDLQNVFNSYTRALVLHHLEDQELL